MYGRRFGVKHYGDICRMVGAEIEPFCIWVTRVADADAMSTLRGEV